MLAEVLVVYLEAKLLFPHFFISLKYIFINAPLTLESRGHMYEFHVDLVVYKLKARQEVFEWQSIQDLVHTFRQKTVEAQVHLLFGSELVLHLGAPD